MLRRRFHKSISVSVAFARSRRAVARRKRSIGKSLLSITYLTATAPHPGAQCAPTLPLQGRVKMASQILMAAIAQRLVRGAFAGAEPDFFVGGRFPFLGAEFASLVRAVAERLRLRAPASAPPVAFAGRDVDRDRPPAADFRNSAHIFFPPPSVASHASPHVLASSRTLKM